MLLLLGTSIWGSLAELLVGLTQKVQERLKKQYVVFHQTAVDDFLSCKRSCMW